LGWSIFPRFKFEFESTEFSAKRIHTVNLFSRQSLIGRKDVSENYEMASSSESDSSGTEKTQKKQYRSWTTNEREVMFKLVRQEHMDLPRVLGPDTWNQRNKPSLPGWPDVAAAFCKIYDRDDVTGEVASRMFFRWAKSVIKKMIAIANDGGRPADHLTPNEQRLLRVSGWPSNMTVPIESTSKQRAGIKRTESSATGSQPMGSSGGSPAKSPRSDEYLSATNTPSPSGQGQAESPDVPQEEQSLQETTQIYCSPDGLTDEEFRRLKEDVVKMHADLLPVQIEFYRLKVASMKKKIEDEQSKK